MKAIAGEGAIRIYDAINVLCGLGMIAKHKHTCSLIKTMPSIICVPEIPIILTVRRTRRKRARIDLQEELEEEEREAQEWKDRWQEEEKSMHIIKQPKHEEAAPIMLWDPLFPPLFVV